MAISLTTPDYPKVSFKVSPLCYACKTYPQYQVAVKLLGSFRLTAGNRHLHRYCIFTEQIPETVLQSLHHSCTSELTRQGISLFVPLYEGPYLHPTFCNVEDARRVVSEGSCDCSLDFPADRLQITDFPAYSHVLDLICITTYRGSFE